VTKAHEFGLGSDATEADVLRLVRIHGFRLSSVVSALFR
jgi:hypothetical protein